MHPARAAITAPETTDPTESLFERMGGHQGVAAFVTAFVTLVRADEELAAILPPAAPGATEAEFQAFFARALGGDAGAGSPDTPLPIWLHPDTFGRVVVHLWTTLLEIDGPDDLKIPVSIAIVQRALGHGDV